MKKVSVALVVLLGLVASGCASLSFSNRGVPWAALYVDAKVNENIEEGKFNKTGESCAKSILGWVALGDASVESAAKAGGIKEVTLVDNTYKSILGLYAKYCVVVHGN